MITRQYVGARYVPKFADPIAYDSTKSYEALTIVEYLGNSYTSKKPVPIGITPANTEYWVLTGNYNAQVESYRQYVVNITNKIINNKARKFILIGDSYGNGVGGAESWFTSFISYLGLTSGIDVFTNSKSSVGFTAQYLGDNFKTLMENINLGSVQKSEITDIIVSGGFNDKTANLYTLTSAIENFVTSAKTNYPNAHVYIAHISWSTNASDRTDMALNSIPGYAQCEQFGATYITNSEYLLHYYSLIQNDTTHPTSAGAKYIGNGLASAIIKGANCGNSIKLSETCTPTPSSIVSTVNNGAYLGQFGNVSYIDFYDTLFTFVSGQTFTCFTEYTLGTLDNNLIRGGDYTRSYLRIPANFKIVHSGGTSILPGYILLEDKTMKFMLTNANLEVTFTNVITLQIVGATATLPTVLC